MEKDDVIANRQLKFSIKNAGTLSPLMIRIHSPFEVKPEEVNFDIRPGTACCRVEFFGLDEPEHVVYGADTLQALELAVNIDPILRGMSKKYDFFFDTGEPYFEDPK